MSCIIKSLSSIESFFADLFRFISDFDCRWRSTARKISEYEYTVLRSRTLCDYILSCFGVIGVIIILMRGSGCSLFLIRLFLSFPVLDFRRPRFFVDTVRDHSRPQSFTVSMRRYSQFVLSLLVPSRFRSWFSPSAFFHGKAIRCANVPGIVNGPTILLSFPFCLIPVCTLSMLDRLCGKDLAWSTNMHNCRSTYSCGVAGPKFGVVWRHSDNRFSNKKTKKKSFLLKIKR